MLSKVKFFQPKRKRLLGRQVVKPNPDQLNRLFQIYVPLSYKANVGPLKHFRLFQMCCN